MGAGDAEDMLYGLGLTLLASAGTLLIVGWWLLAAITFGVAAVLVLAGS